jgi:hypothetical protein
MMGIALQKSGAIAHRCQESKRGEKWCVAGLARSAILANTAITDRGDGPCGHRTLTADRRARRLGGDTASDTASPQVERRPKMNLRAG